MHPLDRAKFGQAVPLDALVLDYGCGQGRLCGELSQPGFRNVHGLDYSDQMIRVAKLRYPLLSFSVVDGITLPYQADSFDVVLLVAVLTCIPLGRSDATVVHRLGETKMIITVFRSRVKPEVQEEYSRWATRMSKLARQMPGYISHKGFIADDGERVTIVEFESEDAQRAWSLHPEHVEAKKEGRSSFYLEYRVQTCSVQRDSAFPKTAV